MLSRLFARPKTVAPSAPTDRPRRVYEARADLRRAFPLGLTPQQRDAYRAWLMGDGRAVLGLRDDEIESYMAELAADPSAGLAATYSLSPQWQKAVPDALTPAGWPKLKLYLRGEYDITGRWLAAAKCPPAMPSRHPGVNVLGFFRYASGVQEAIRSSVACLRREGYSTATRDVPVEFDCDWRDRERYQDCELFDVSLISSGAFESLASLYERAGLHPREGVHRVAMLFWELETMPPAALEGAALADEFWAPTEFVAESLRSSGTTKPVVAMLPGLEPPPFVPLPRSRFGLDASKFLFLFMFDMGSVMARKNPLGLIRAFRAAFGPSEQVQLAVKVSRGSARPDDLAELLDAARQAGVTVIDRVMTREESFGLLASCDSYVSLHRSEGLGLSLAEAMMMGKPTVATGYSGNLDFMCPETSLLVKCGRATIERDIGPYPAGSVWGEPDLDDAARCLRWVYDNPAEAWAMGRRAREAVRSRFSPEAAGHRMARRIEQIRESRR